MTGTAVTKAKDQRVALKATLSQFSDSFARVLPRHMTPDRMVQLALVAATKNPKILECTPESIALSVMQISQWGLDIGRTAHLVPFGNVCTAIADWKGLVQLMVQSGHVRDVRARCVYANERFVEKGGLDETLEHEIVHDPKQRGALKGAYAYAVLRHGRGTWEFMSVEEIERIRNKAQSKNSPAWKDHYDEMAKKTAIRRLAKRLPQNANLDRALEADDAPTEVLARFASSVGVQPQDVARLTAGDEEGWNSTAVRGIPNQNNDVYDATEPTPTDDEGRPIPPETVVGGDGELPLGDAPRKRGRNAIAEGQ